MPSGRDRPLSNTDPPSCNSSALTSRRTFVLLVPEPTFSERSLQWLLFATRHFCRFGSFLTSTAPSAGGITPFLQNCHLTISRLYSDSHTTSQDLIYLSDMDELYCWSMRILKDADRQPVYFVNQTQFTKQASDSLDNTVFADSSDGFFDGTKTPHAPSTGKKHML